MAGLKIKCDICNTSFGLESSKLQNVDNKPSVEDTAEHLVEELTEDKQTIKN